MIATEEAISRRRLRRSDFKKSEKGKQNKKPNRLS